MTASDSYVKAGRSLASMLADQQMLGAPQAVAVLRQVSARVARMHEAGVLHRNIAPESVHFDESGALVVTVSSPVSDNTPVNRELVDLIPDLAKLHPAALAADLAAVRRRFIDAGIALDPRAIDVCQMGALLCRMLTGELAGTYRRSPRVKGKVPARLRPIIERALGLDGQTRFADAVEFLEA